MLNIDDVADIITLDSLTESETNFRLLRKNTDVISNMLMVSQYGKLQDYGYKMNNCATYLKFGQCENGLKLLDANFCRVRVCPICQWRRALKYRSIYFKKIQAMINLTPNWQLLTLTIKSPPINKLGETVDRMQNAYRKIFRADNVQSVLGDRPEWIRCLEVNYNPERKQYSHPHYHVLLGFKEGHYISQPDWCRLWKRGLEINYRPIVDIRQAKSPLCKKSLCEILKYISKPSDLIKGGRQWVENYSLEMEGKRCIESSQFFKNYGGIWTPNGKENLINVGGDGEKVELPDLDRLEFRYNRELKTYTLER